ncbi:leucine-rich repeat protein [Butyrivibrio sp. XPD2002]|uniref:leucine-rich repeat protein n=1 Tax=Butyrivibrio sp. XPD2002 TaxID=1280665 RepID=UPI0003F6C1DA|nr:leucine-rich repeat protein [Butyrivibrio sp. XPD2002]
MKMIDKVKKKLSLYLVLSLVISILLPAGALGNYGLTSMAHAARKFPAGDKYVLPEMKNRGVTHVDRTQKQNTHRYIDKNTSVSYGKHYDCLTESEKTIYRAIYHAIKDKHYIPFRLYEKNLSYEELKDYIWIYRTGPNSITSDEITDEFGIAWCAIYYDHPENVEFFLVQPNECGSFVSEENGIKVYEDYVILCAEYDDTRFAQLDQQILAAKSKWIAELKERNLVTASKAATEFNVHNYYVQTVTYGGIESSDVNLAHTAWGSLCARRAVCDGFSTGFEVIMEALGFNVLVNDGATNDQGEDLGLHAWNLIELDGAWYEVDTTWTVFVDDYGQVVFDKSFFNRTTEEYKQLDHYRIWGHKCIGTRLPVATGTLYTFDYVLNNFDSLIARYICQLPIRIALGTSAVTLNKGDKMEIKPIFEPSDTVLKSYGIESNNTDVVEVFGNTIYAKDVGNATIKVFSGVSDFFKGVDVHTTLSVTVIPPAADDTSRDPKNDGESMVSGGASYEIISANARTALFKRLKNKSAKSVTIPSEVTDDHGVSYTVTEIAKGAFKKRKKLKKVTIPKTVKRIRRNAFADCKNLKKITIYANPKLKIDDGAFKINNEDVVIKVKGVKGKQRKKIIEMLKKQTNVRVK